MDMILVKKIRAKNLEVIQKSKALPVGTIREWRGKKYQKTAQGWVPYREKVAATTADADDASMRDLLSAKGKSNAIGSERGTEVSDGVSVLVSDTGSTRFVYSEGGKRKAVLQVMSRDGKAGTITNVYVLPEARRSGLASALRKKAEAKFSSLKMSDFITPDGAAWYSSNKVVKGGSMSGIQALLKGKKLPVGTIREWRGRKYQKTSNGWVLYREPKLEGREKKFGDLKGQRKGLVALAQKIDKMPDSEDKKKLVEQARAIMQSIDSGNRKAAASGIVAMEKVLGRAKVGGTIKQAFGKLKQSLVEGTKTDEDTKTGADKHAAVQAAEAVEAGVKAAAPAVKNMSGDTPDAMAAAGDASEKVGVDAKKKAALSAKKNAKDMGDLKTFKVYGHDGSEIKVEPGTVFDKFDVPGLDRELVGFKIKFPNGSDGFAVADKKSGTLLTRTSGGKQKARNEFKALLGKHGEAKMHEMIDKKHEERKRVESENAAKADAEKKSSDKRLQTEHKKRETDRAEQKRRDGTAQDRYEQARVDAKRLDGMLKQYDLKFVDGKVVDAYTNHRDRTVENREVPEAQLKEELGDDYEKFKQAVDARVNMAKLKDAALDEAGQGKLFKAKRGLMGKWTINRTDGKQPAKKLDTPAELEAVNKALNTEDAVVWLNKGSGLPVGTEREYHGKLYVKEGPGKWVGVEKSKKEAVGTVRVRGDGSKWVKRGENDWRQLRADGSHGEQRHIYPGVPEKGSQESQAKSSGASTVEKLKGIISGSEGDIRKKRDAVADRINKGDKSTEAKKEYMILNAAYNIKCGSGKHDVEGIAKEIDKSFKKDAAKSLEIDDVAPAEFAKSVRDEEAFWQLNKGKGLPIGTVRDWKGKKYQKTADGWKRHREGNGKDKDGFTDDDKYMKIPENRRSTDFSVGSKHVVSAGSGLASGKEVTVIKPYDWKQANDGTYSQPGRDHVPIQYANGDKGFMVKDRLLKPKVSGGGQGDGNAPYKPASVEVTNLATGEKKTYANMTHEEAVSAAHRESGGHDSEPVTRAAWSVAKGDWAALVHKPTAAEVAARQGDTTKQSKPSEKTAGTISSRGLMSLDSTLWNKLKIGSGSDIYESPDVAKKYVAAVIGEMERRGIKELPKKVYDKLEDENFHSLNAVLTHAGYFGADEQKRAAEFDEHLKQKGLDNSSRTIIDAVRELRGTK